jgi:hypothetical protein
MATQKPFRALVDEIFITGFFMKKLLYRKTSEEVL